MECDDDLKNTIRSQLARFPVQAAEVEDARHAAVAITVTDTGYGADLPGLPRHEDWQTAAALVLTRRSAHLRNHPGQWAFPGGRLDPGEGPVATALRPIMATF